MALFEKHEALLNKAIAALHARTFFSAFPEQSSPSVYGEQANKDGQERFTHMLG